MVISLLRPDQYDVWTDYVMHHPRGTVYHLPGWKNVIEKSYGHNTYYLLATRIEYSSQSGAARAEQIGFPRIERPMGHGRETSCRVESAQEMGKNWPSEVVVGVLPLVHLKHPLFSNSLISIPFFDLGGILAVDLQTEKALLREAIKIAQELRANEVELRHVDALQSINNGQAVEIESSDCPCICRTRSHKVRMLLELPESADALMKSFKSKLRSQLKKPVKEGLKAKVGGRELLEDFYRVFAVNMRDLGSPVHSRKMMVNVIKHFGEHSRVVMVYKEDVPLACSLVVGFRDTLENPWASSLREYGHLSPNMLLYWTMLEYACGKGYRYFDFGRSSKDEGTYRFKEQWGAIPMPLHWQYVSFDASQADGDALEVSRFKRAIHYWQKLPVSVSQFLGPMIRKYIGL